MRETDGISAEPSTVPLVISLRAKVMREVEIVATAPQQTARSSLMSDFSASVASSALHTAPLLVLRAGRHAGRAVTVPHNNLPSAQSCFSCSLGEGDALSVSSCSSCARRTCSNW